MARASAHLAEAARKALDLEAENERLSLTSERLAAENERLREIAVHAAAFLAFIGEPAMADELRAELNGQMREAA